MKKILSLLLVICMVFSMSTVAMAASFTDVDSDVAQSEAIDVLATLEVIEGYGNGVYGPNDSLTRAQLCTMLVRAIYGSDVHYNNVDVFNDVPVNHWARVYIDTAYANDLMVGYGNDKFGPEDGLTYTQTARTILNALGYGTLAWPTGVDTMAYELGLYDNLGVINSSAVCTRAHAAQMIYNAFDCHLVKVVTGQTITTNKLFLEDILGYVEVTHVDEYNRHWVGYEDTEGEVYVTDIEIGYTDTIYPAGENHYKFTKNSSKTYAIDWYWLNNTKDENVKLYVNGVEITMDSENIWASVESGIGYFNADDELTAIYVERDGIIWIPSIGYNTNAVPADIRAEVADDYDLTRWNLIVTYFEESDEWIVSYNTTVGYVSAIRYSDRTYEFVTINNVEYEVSRSHDYQIGDLVVIYLDSENEVIVSALVENLEDGFRFNTATGKYHTPWCAYVTNGMDTAETLKTSGTESVYVFDPCGHCHPGDVITVEGKNADVIYPALGKSGKDSQANIPGYGFRHDTDPEGTNHQVGWYWFTADDDGLSSDTYLYQDGKPVTQGSEILWANAEWGILVEVSDNEYRIYID